MKTKKFIAGSKNYCTVHNHINAPLFKTIFDCSDCKNSHLEISAVGFYRLFLNGKELTKGVLSPYISNPDDLVYYDEYCVDKVLKEKNNVLCVLLGNGFSNAMDNNIWGFEEASFRSAPKFYLSLFAGGKEIVNTENGFRVTDSPITFDDIRCGERYDARLEENSLFSPEFSEKFRDVVPAETPLGEYKKCEAHPVRILGTIRVKRIIKAKKGYIYDFGEVNSGVCKLSVNAKAGQVIDLSFVEMISAGEPDFSALLFKDNGYPLEYVQHDKYICKDGYQEYTPSFTYHGFQYCYVEGITEEQATDNLLEMKILHSDFPKRGSFRCSNPIINKIQDASMRSAESNFVYFITDCPQREKNGWTSEGHVTAEYALRFYDCADSLKEWLNNIRKAQRPNGQLPGIIPTTGWGFQWGNGPQWDKIIVELPYLLYIYTGDIESVRENIDAIAKWIEFLNTKTNGNGLVSYGLPDWCEAGGPGDGNCSTPVEITDTLISIENLRKAKMLFGLCSVNKYNNLIDDMLDGYIKNFKEKYIRNSAVVCKTQTAQALALELGLFEDNAKAFEQLLEIIKNDNNHMHCGVLGFRPVFRMLAEYGQSSLAYKMIVQDTHPSYGNIIKQGATGMWEKFTEYYETPNGIRQKDGRERNYSLNHSVFGGITSFFMEYFAGIRVISHDTLEISPVLLKELSDIEASFENNGKKVIVKIENIEDRFKISVTNNGFKCHIKPLEKNQKGTVECLDGEVTVLYVNEG